MPIDRSNREYFVEDFLFKRNERVPDVELCGEEKVLNSPIVERGFEKICDTYNPRHKNVLFSLCASTRPYLKSYKWMKLNEFFGTTCDLIIISNGGIIPMEYMYCYPYLTYDAPHSEGGEFDELYKDKMKRRLNTFLQKFGKNWDTKIYLFNEGTRNWQAVLEMGLDYLIPAPGFKTAHPEKVYLGFNEMRYPQLNYHILMEIARLTHTELTLQPKDKIEVVMEDYILGLSNKGYTINELTQIFLKKYPMYTEGYVSTYIKKITKDYVAPDADKYICGLEKKFIMIDELIYTINSKDKIIQKKQSLFY